MIDREDRLGSGRDVGRKNAQVPFPPRIHDISVVNPSYTTTHNSREFFYSKK